MTAVRFLEPAEVEIRETVDYLNAQIAHLGDRFAAEVQAALGLIAEHPRIGFSLTRRVKKFRLRTFPYNVVYMRNRDEILIVAVAHHRRRPTYWRARLRELP